MTTTTKTLTANKVHAVLRAAGVEKSDTHSSGRIPGMNSTTYGYSVETNGYTESTCRYCKGINRHATIDCIGRPTRNTKDALRARKVATGTFTVRLNERTGVCGMNDRRTDADRVRVTAALTAAGLPFVQVGDNEWLVG